MGRPKSGLYEVLDDERARDSRHQRVLLHVHAVRLDGGQAVLFCELILCVDNDGLDSTAVESTLAHRFHILAALTKVEGHSDNLAAGHFGQVGNGDGSIQTARVGKHNACSHSYWLL